MKIKLLRAWKRHKLDSVMVVPDGVANVLIKRGIAAQDKIDEKLHKSYHGPHGRTGHNR